MKRNPLYAVTDDPIPVDIYAIWREEISARDWEGIHISGDRRSAVDLPDGRKGWRK